MNDVPSPYMGVPIDDEKIEKIMDILDADGMVIFTAKADDLAGQFTVTNLCAHNLVSIAEMILSIALEEFKNGHTH